MLHPLVVPAACFVAGVAVGVVVVKHGPKVYDKARDGVAKFLDPNTAEE